jgi:hypothetical protein
MLLTAGSLTCSTALLPYCKGSNIAILAAALQAYLWPVNNSKPWPSLPVRLYKAKRAMRMALVNPGQSNMLLTGELAGKDCTARQLLQATPAAVKAAMRCSRRHAATAAAARHSWQLLGQHGTELRLQQQQQQQQLDGQLLHRTSTAGAASSSNGSIRNAVCELQEQLAKVRTAEVAAGGDPCGVNHLGQQQTLQQQQQHGHGNSAFVDQQQILLDAVQGDEAVPQQQEHQQQQQQLPAGAPAMSTTLLQRIGASLWSRRSSRSTSETASEAATASQAPCEHAAAGATVVNPTNQLDALAASLRQLLAAVQQVAAAAAHLTDEADEVDMCNAAASAEQDHMLDLALQLQQHQLCGADEAAKLCCMLRCSRQLRHAMLQLPGFDCNWGLDVAGRAAQLGLFRRPVMASGGLTVAPVALDIMSTAGASLQALARSCRAVQAAAAAAAAEASTCESTAAAAAQLAQHLAHEVEACPASIGALQAQHSQQLQAVGEASKPCLAVLRVWSLQPQQQCSCRMPQQLTPEQQQLMLPFVVLCSERSVGVSPCGRLLVAVVAVQSACSSSSNSSSRGEDALGQLDASKEEFYQVSTLCWRCAAYLYGILPGPL